MSGLGDGWGMKPAIGRHDLLKVSIIILNMWLHLSIICLANNKYFYVTFYVYFCENSQVLVCFVSFVITFCSKSHRLVIDFNRFSFQLQQM
jgi:hypothetical protein